MDSWKFFYREFLWGYVVLAALAIIAAVILVRREKIYSRLGDYGLIHMLIPNVSQTKRWVKFVLWILACGFFIFGISDFQYGTKTEEVKREGADIMVCLDVSKSMLAQDIRPNRLVRAIQSMEKFIERLQGDRLGIVVFAGSAYVQLPLTTDYSSAKVFLESISPDMVPVQGTNISEAISKAAESFGSDQGKNRAIIVITDGEDHEEDAIKIAEEAGEKQIMINTIGIGSENGVPIPEYNGGMQIGFKKDRDGKTIISKLNSDLLKQIAGKANGVYAQATNADIGLNAILDKINELDKKKIESQQYSDYEDQFQVFFLFALVIFLIEFLISERVSTLWKKVNLFKE
jgi:Ca-activated chloride channel homolog